MIIATYGIHAFTIDPSIGLPQAVDFWKYPQRSLVKKIKGSSWHGRVVGFYSTDLTPRGYCVESINEPGSVQIYPEAALEPWDGEK